MKAKWKIIFLLAICFAGSFAYLSGCYAVTIYVANYGDGTCSLANATSAYNAASAGDTVVFPAGNCTWASSLNITKPLSMIGAGTSADGTKLTAGGTLPQGFFYINGFNSNVLMRISSFYFEMTNQTPLMAINVSNVIADNIRIDHNNFNQGRQAIIFNNPKGVIDNNYFQNQFAPIYFSAGSRANADASWASMAAGTAEALFIEDNHFIDNADYLPATSYAKVDTFSGGKLVVRYNHYDFLSIPHNTTTIPQQTHGSDFGYWQKDATNVRRGQSVVEFYENEMSAKRLDFLVVFRGSANLIYNNKIIGSLSQAPGFKFYEEEYFLGNVGEYNPNRLVWPAEDQVHNTFIWNNIYNGLPITNVSVLPSNLYCTGSGAPYSCCTGSKTGTCDDIIKKDRDYFLHKPCGASDLLDPYGNTCTHGKETFTGNNGASGSYPTDGVLYPTLGTMVFSATGDNAYYGYTPYTYPHPLTAPMPPGNLRISN